MSNDITIRQIRIQDEIPLLNSLYWGEYEKGTLGGVLPPMSEKEIVDNKYYFIQKKEQIIGAFAFLSFPALPIQFTDQPHFMRLILKEEFRGKKIFRKVHELALIEAKKLGYTAIYTRINPSNSQMLWVIQKYGWEKIADDSVDSSQLDKKQMYKRVLSLILEKSGKEQVYEDIIFKKEL
ncbi:MAG: hypothetical protein ABIG20_03170 [archaeon]